jgi:excisionase family DNA binding protein
MRGGARKGATAFQVFKKTFKPRVIKLATEATAMSESKTIEATTAIVEPYIDKRELARRLSIKLRTVESWMNRDWIPYYKMGKVVLFKWTEVDAEVSRMGRKAQNGVLIQSSKN